MISRDIFLFYLCAVALVAKHIAAEDPFDRSLTPNFFQNRAKGDHNAAVETVNVTEPELIDYVDKIETTSPQTPANTSDVIKSGSEAANANDSNKLNATTSSDGNQKCTKEGVTDTSPRSLYCPTMHSKECGDNKGKGVPCGCDRDCDGSKKCCDMPCGKRCRKATSLKPK